MIMSIIVVRSILNTTAMTALKTTFNTIAETTVTIINEIIIRFLCVLRVLCVSVRRNATIDEIANSNSVLINESFSREPI